MTTKQLSAGVSATTEPVRAAPTAPAPGGRPRMRNPFVDGPLKGLQPFISFIVFLVFFGALGIWLGGRFLTVDARMLDVHQNASIYVLALAAMATLVCGQFDLSIASMATLTSFTTLLLVSSDGLPMWLAIVCSILIGAAGGLLNALLVVRWRVNAFVATLGTGGLFLGLSQVISGGTQVVASFTHPLPRWFTGTGSLGDFNAHFPAFVLWIALVLAVVGLTRAILRAQPAAVTTTRWRAFTAVAIVALIAFLVFALKINRAISATSWTSGVLLVIAVVLWLVFELTVSGRHFYAVGNNAEASRLAGVKVERTTIKAFVIGGMLSGVAGILLVANQGVAVPDGAGSFLLPAFAAAYLSTELFSAGRFNVWGTLIGGIFLQWTAQGLIVGGLPNTWTSIVNGVVLILAVAFSTTLQRAVRR